MRVCDLRQTKTTVIINDSNAAVTFARFWSSCTNRISLVICVSSLCSLPNIYFSVQFPFCLFLCFYVCVCFYVIASVCCLWALLPELKWMNCIRRTHCISRNTSFCDVIIQDAVIWVPVNIRDVCGLVGVRGIQWSYGILLWELMTRGSKPYDGIEAQRMKRYLQGGNRLQMPSPTTPNFVSVFTVCLVHIYYLFPNATPNEANLSNNSCGFWL